MSAFLKKDIREILKTYRLWAIPVIFLFIGISAPASTKFLPAIMKPQLEAQGITLVLPELGAVAAYQAYFKNLTQIGLLAVILFTMGLVSEERGRGILAQVAAKPVSRRSIVAAKWVVHGAWFFLCLALGAVACYLYTIALFNGAPLLAFAKANLVFAAYLIFIFSLTLAASTVLQSQVAAGAASLVGFSIVSLASFFSRTLARYSPAALNTAADKIVAGQAELGAAARPAATALVLAIILIAGAVAVFDRQEL